ncbi:hypothetical protein JL09_g6657, partial [Pichia kudriavzevii]
ETSKGAIDLPSPQA